MKVEKARRFRDMPTKHVMRKQTWHDANPMVPDLLISCGAARCTTTKRQFDVCQLHLHSIHYHRAANKKSRNERCDWRKAGLTSPSWIIDAPHCGAQILRLRLRKKEEAGRFVIPPTVTHCR